jgi:hypothetical protein
MNPRAKKASRGQAMVEMILSIPLLFLMIAGMIQFTLLFLAKVQFEHACGVAARQYASGIASDASMKNEIWNNLGGYQVYFDKYSIQLVSEKPSSPIGNFISRFGRWLSPFTRILRNIGADTPFSYGGFKWQVTAKCKMFSSFGVLFGRGITFRTQLAVIRYPK